MSSKPKVVRVQERWTRAALEGTLPRVQGALGKIEEEWRNVVTWWRKIHTWCDDHGNRVDVKVLHFEEFSGHLNDALLLNATASHLGAFVLLLLHDFVHPLCTLVPGAKLCLQDFQVTSCHYIDRSSGTNCHIGYSCTARIERISQTRNGGSKCSSTCHILSTATLLKKSDKIATFQDYCAAHHYVYLSCLFTNGYRFLWCPRTKWTTPEPKHCRSTRVYVIESSS